MRRLSLLALFSVLAALCPAAASDGKPTFHGIAGLAADLGNGALYLLDKEYSAVFRIAPGGTVVQPFAGAAEAGWNGDGKPALATRFNAPAAFSLDLRTGELFIADTSNY